MRAPTKRLSLAKWIWSLIQSLREPNRSGSCRGKSAKLAKPKLFGQSDANENYV